MSLKKLNLLSIIIPVYDEEENVRDVLAEIKDVFSSEKNLKWEAIFVDDGSTDGTFNVLKTLVSKSPKVRAIRLRHNMGKSCAYTVGFQHAEGEVIATIDGDMQDDPRDILKLLKRLDEDCDAVVGWKHRGKGQTSKGLVSKLFNFVISRLFKTSFNDLNCPLRVIRASAIESLDLYGYLYRFIPLLLVVNGYRVVEVKVKNRPRHRGRSKFSKSKMLKGVFDVSTVLFLIRYGDRPLHLFGLGGLCVFLVGFIVDLAIVIEWIFILGVTQQIGHSLLLIFGVFLMLMGLQLFSVGLLGELLVSNRNKSVEELPIAEILE